MSNNKPKYLVQCAKCGTPLFKTEQGLMFNTQIKCSGCEKILRIPDDVVVTVDKKTLDNNNKNGVKLK